jgi:integrating conjugative element protein (TIGR03761 family)
MKPANHAKMGSVTALSDIQIELATRPALRIWEGREKTPQRHGILGIPGFCKFMKGIEQAIREDDPYADYHYQKVEESVSNLTFDLDTELKDIKQLIEERTPAAMKLPEIGSKNPVVVPIRFASQVGFKLVYELLKLDQIVLKVLLANHIGILPNKDKFEALDRLERKVRAVMNLVYAFRYTGVTRDDIAANNQKAIQAKGLMGELALGYLDGSVRSNSAPSLPLKRLQTLNGRVTGSIDASIEQEGTAKESAADLFEISDEIDRVLQDVVVSDKSSKSSRVRKAGVEKKKEATA